MCSTTSAASTTGRDDLGAPGGTVNDQRRRQQQQQQQQQQPGTSGRGEERAAGGGDESGELPDLGRGGVCSCQYRSLSLMELQTFVKLCSDNRTINAVREDRGDRKGADRAMTWSGLSKKVETAFLTACSIGGVYCRDTSVGIHDQPVSAQDLASIRPQTSEVRSTSSGVRRATYGTLFDASSTKAARHSARPGAPQAKVYQNLGFGGLNLNTSPRSSLAPSAASYSGTPKPAGAHRKPVATLNFPQFLEALRLVAEDLIGHPAVLASVELALWAILSDMISIGCPLPAEHKWGLAWGAERPTDRFEEGGPLESMYKQQRAAASGGPEWGFDE